MCAIDIRDAEMRRASIAKEKKKELEGAFIGSGRFSKDVDNVCWPVVDWKEGFTIQIVRDLKAVAIVVVVFSVV